MGSSKHPHLFDSQTTFRIIINYDKTFGGILIAFREKKKVKKKKKVSFLPLLFLQNKHAVGYLQLTCTLGIPLLYYPYIKGDQD